MHITGVAEWIPRAKPLHPQCGRLGCACGCGVGTGVGAGVRGGAETLHGAPLLGTRTLR